jgi:hypothetical protein
MSRGAEARDVAWQVWLCLYEHDVFGQPVAYEHQCGSLGHVPPMGDYHEIVCPGCRFELSRPETECTPLYKRPERD